jgi:hypothetical protein
MHVPLIALTHDHNVVETLEQKEARRRQQFNKAQQKEIKQRRQQAKASERERYQNQENIGQ